MMAGATIAASVALTVVLVQCGKEMAGAWEVRREAMREELATLRASTRAYDSAPPVIPHAVQSLGRENCLSCHAPGSPANASRIASPRSHPAWGDCRQCHVERHSRLVFRETSFEPYREPAWGHRQYAGAPPMTPHAIQNRNNCSICHVGEQAHPALRAKHEFRPNCAQCHVPMFPPDSVAVNQVEAMFSEVLC